MGLPSIVTDKKTRDDLREKFEVAMAVIVLTGFIYKKFQKSDDGYVDISSLPKEKS